MRIHKESGMKQRIIEGLIITIVGGIVVELVVFPLTTGQVPAIFHGTKEENTSSISILDLDKPSSQDAMDTEENIRSDSVELSSGKHTPSPQDATDTEENISGNSVELSSGKHTPSPQNATDTEENISADSVELSSRKHTPSPKASATPNLSMSSTASPTFTPIPASTFTTPPISVPTPSPDLSNGFMLNSRYHSNGMVYLIGELESNDFETVDVTVQFTNPEILGWIVDIGNETWNSSETLTFFYDYDKGLRLSITPGKYVFRAYEKHADMRYSKSAVIDIDGSSTNIVATLTSP